MPSGSDLESLKMRVARLDRVWIYGQISKRLPTYNRDFLLRCLIPVVGLLHGMLLNKG